MIVVMVMVMVMVMVAIAGAVPQGTGQQLAHALLQVKGLLLWQW